MRNRTIPGRSSSTPAVVAVLLPSAALLLASTAQAQNIEGKTQIGLGLGLASYIKTTSSADLPGVDDVEVTTTGFGTLESSTIRLGYGVRDDVVLSIDVSASLQTQSQDDTDQITATTISLAPTASYVFSGATVRPFLLGSVGIIAASTESGDVESSTTVFGFSGGIGLHWFATESVSLSPTLTAGYFFGSTEVEAGGPAVEGDANVLIVGLGVMLAAWL